MYKIKGLVVSGPGPTKEEFINGNHLEYRLQDMIIATIDSSYSGAEGIREAFAKAGNILASFRMVEEKKLVDGLFGEINRQTGLGSYGLDEVVAHLKNKAVKVAIITDDTDLYRIDVKCRRCGHHQEETVKTVDVIQTKSRHTGGPCPSCNALEIEATSQDIVDYLATTAAQFGSEVEVVSGIAEHGRMLASLGSIGAILRYNPGHA